MKKFQTPKTEIPSNKYPHGEVSDALPSSRRDVLRWEEA